MEIVGRVENWLSATTIASGHDALQVLSSRFALQRCVSKRQETVGSETNVVLNIVLQDLMNQSTMNGVFGANFASLTSSGRNNPTSFGGQNTFGSRNPDDNHATRKGWSYEPPVSLAD